MKSKQNDAQLIAESYASMMKKTKEHAKAKEDKVDAALAKGDIDERDAREIRKMSEEDGEGRRRRRALPSVAAMLGAAEREAVEKARAEGKKEEPKKKFPRPETGADLAARMSKPTEDAEHEAPVEVDMSQNPDPKSLEVVKVEEPAEEPVEAPAIHPDVEEEPRVNHHDDSEIKMALSELYKIEKYAFGLSLMLKELPALEGWTASKITKAADYLGSVFHKLDYDFASGEHATMAPKAEDHEGH